MTEKQLYEKIEELESILENLCDGIYITDGLGNTLRINKTYEKMSGLKAEELVGKNMKQLVDQGYFSESASLLVMKTKAPATAMYTVKTGKRLLVKGVPVFTNNGELIRIVNSVWDITEVHNLQAQVEKSKSVQNITSDPESLQVEGEFICQSKNMEKIVDTAIRVARVDSTVLILGESGVGKEIISKFIHNASARSKGPFVKINCAAIPDNLLESELFGYRAGAFTGALKEGKPGIFETAGGGTIFLDEIGEIPLHLQAKLLRVLQDMEVTRLGDIKPKAVQARIITATNRNLEEMVAQGKFRQDLYYRLNVVPIRIAALRDRVEDIEPLTLYFLIKFNKKYNTEKWIADDAIEVLKTYPWPGNVRELENFIERIIVLKNESLITKDEIQDFLSMAAPETYTKQEDNLKNALDNLEKHMITKAMEKHKTTRAAAKALGIDQSTLVRKLAKHQ
jgi:PAS domain S-box-containing protein